MKRLLYIIMAISLFGWVYSAQSSPADQPATQEDIKKYLQITSSHDIFKPINTMMIKTIQESIHQMYLKHKDQLPPDYEARIDPIISDMLENMPWNEVMQAIIPVYQKHLTHDDMKNVIAFYSSPTGKKLIREESALIVESRQYAMPIMKNYLEEVKQKIQVKTAEMIMEQFNAATTAAPDPDFLKSKDDIECVSQKKDTGEFVFTPCELSTSTMPQSSKFMMSSSPPGKNCDYKGEVKGSQRIGLDTDSFARAKADVQVKTVMLSANYLQLISSTDLTGADFLMGHAYFCSNLDF